VFSEERLQTIENKRQECSKKRKESGKRLQALEDSRLEGGRSSRRTEERMTARVHRCGDGKYAQLVEGGGDRGAAWRMRWRERERPGDADVPPTPGVLGKEFGSC
jgi:hypothetical protein